MMKAFSLVTSKSNVFRDESKNHVNQEGNCSVKNINYPPLIVQLFIQFIFIKIG